MIAGNRSRSSGGVDRLQCCAGGSDQHCHGSWPGWQPVCSDLFDRNITKLSATCKLQNTR